MPLKKKQTFKSPAHSLTHLIKMRLFLVYLLMLLYFDVISILGDVGTAASYNPPYLPTKCNGNDPQQFPQGGYFAAASDGIWDNGAACGRKYKMRCISGLKRPCRDGSIIVEVVDFCHTNPLFPTVQASPCCLSSASSSKGSDIAVMVLKYKDVNLSSKNQAQQRSIRWAKNHQHKTSQ
ncbi:hypothetical protein RJ641_022208 [Dillenia turbinata]|uniref:Expansin-like EG45 domain-containing protein n=1 Tax=Dillenia turbinata TaxID=194707 RepID=A0AAN8ULG4_9MAGN